MLVDGQVAGTWRIDDARVVVEWLDGLPARYAADVEDERRALQAFVT